MNFFANIYMLIAIILILILLFLNMSSECKVSGGGLKHFYEQLDTVENKYCIKNDEKTIISNAKGDMTADYPWYPYVGNSIHCYHDNKIKPKHAKTHW